MYLQCTQKELILLSISYPYGNILPCLKLSLIAQLNLKLINLEEVRKMRNFPQMLLSLCFTSPYLWVNQIKTM